MTALTPANFVLVGLTIRPFMWLFPKMRKTIHVMSSLPIILHRKSGMKISKPGDKNEMCHLQTG